MVRWSSREAISLLGTIESMALTLEQANLIIASALEASERAGYPPMAVVVLDDSGHIKSVQREDVARAVSDACARASDWPLHWPFHQWHGGRSFLGVRARIPVY